MFLGFEENRCYLCYASPGSDVLDRDKARYVGRYGRHVLCLRNVHGVVLGDLGCILGVWGLTARLAGDDPP